MSHKNADATPAIISRIMPDFVVFALTKMLSLFLKSFRRLPKVHKNALTTTCKNQVSKKRIVAAEPSSVPEITDATSAIISRNIPDSAIFVSLLMSQRMSHRFLKSFRPLKVVCRFKMHKNADATPANISRIMPFFVYFVCMKNVCGFCEIFQTLRDDSNFRVNHVWTAPCVSRGL